MVLGPWLVAFISHHVVGLPSDKVNRSRNGFDLSGSQPDGSRETRDSC